MKIYYQGHTMTNESFKKEKGTFLIIYTTKVRFNGIAKRGTCDQKEVIKKSLNRTKRPIVRLWLKGYVFSNTGKILLGTTRARFNGMLIANRGT